MSRYFSDKLEDLDLPDEPRFRQYKKRRKKGGRIFKSCGCCLGSLLIIFVLLYFSVRLVVLPAMDKLAALPSDFPKEFAVYQVENAKIQMENPETRAKIISFAQSLPDWILAPLWRYLAGDVRERLSATLGDGVKIPENFSLADFRQLMASSSVAQASKVSLSWDWVNKSKEEMMAWYKDNLAKNGFQFKENLSDYEINLGFWKDDIFGLINFGDKPGTTTASQVKLDINYFNKYAPPAGAPYVNTWNKN